VSEPLAVWIALVGRLWLRWRSEGEALVEKRRRGSFDLYSVTKLA